MSITNSGTSFARQSLQRVALLEEAIAGVTDDTVFPPWGTMKGYGSPRERDSIQTTTGEVEPFTPRY
jgi:hypothetical protein